MTLINQDTARSVVKAIGINSREAIIQRARDMQANIEQIFSDAEHWNRVNVPWKGLPINPDADGKLRRIADGIDKMLANETPNL